MTSEYRIFRLSSIFRLRVLGNEVEILQNNATQRTKQLKKAELNHAKHCSERDALRNERAKMNSSQAQIDVQISSRKLEIERLNLMSQRAEEDARNLLVQYEKVDFCHQRFRLFFNCSANPTLGCSTSKRAWCHPS